MLVFEVIMEGIRFIGLLIVLVMMLFRGNGIVMAWMSVLLPCWRVLRFIMLIVMI